MRRSLVYKFLLPLLLVALSSPAWAKPPKVGTPAPDFELPELHTGTKVKLSAHRGKVVLIDFWATWCGPCKKELPELAKMYAELGKSGFVVLAISVDEDRGEAQRFATARKMALPLLSDTTGEVAARYDLPKMPTSFLVDKKGVVRLVHEGYKAGDERKIAAEVRKLLAE